MSEIIDAVECVALDREAVISVQDGMAVVRVSGKGPTAVHLGMPPAHAVRLGAAFIRAGLHIDPSLSTELLEATIKSENSEHNRKQRGKA